jgi:hypothetical protein
MENWATWSKQPFLLQKHLQIDKKGLENLGRNWDRGNFTFRNIDCGLEGPFLKLSEKYLAAGEDFTIKLES